MIKVADEVWLVTALLHREHPERLDFTISEIVQRAVHENMAGGYRPGLQVHASTHCVASKMPNPATFRMLSETQRGRRRLFRMGDPVHAGRERGRIRPELEDTPPNLHKLLEWYDHVYVNGKTMPKYPVGMTGSSILKYVGILSKQDAREMMEAIQSCEKVDHDGW